MSKQGLINTPGYKYNTGIGYVAIPQDLDRDKYIKDCYANSHISMQTEDGGFHNRIPVPPEVMNFLEFPTKLEELGTPVIYVTDQQYQHHYIIARFQRRDQLGDNSEHKFKFTRHFEDSFIEISGSAKDKAINLLLNGGDKSGKLIVNLFNKNKDCEINIDVQGNVNVKSTGDVNLEQYGTFTVKTIDADDNSAKFTQSAKENKFYNEKFYLNDGEEAMLLGKKVKKFLDDLLDELGQTTTATAIGIQPILNAAKLLKFKERTEELLSKKAFID